MNFFLHLFTTEAGKPAGLAKNGSLKPEVPHHKEDTSQGSEFLDDVIWVKNPILRSESQRDFHADVDQWLTALLGQNRIHK